MGYARLPPLSSLRSFEAAARHGSFTEAGTELNVTHAAISQQVRRLEEHLGLELMRRRGRGVELTEQGQQLAAQLTQAFGIVARAIDDVTSSEASRPLKITLTPMFTATWLMPRLGAFRAAHPDVELNLDPRSETIDIPAGGYDIGIRYGAGEWPGLGSRLLLPANFVVLVARSLLESLPGDQPPDLLRLPWLQEQGTDEIRLWMKRQGIDVEGKTDIIHMPGYLTLPALLDGQGVAAMTRAFVEEEIADGRLVVLHEDDRAGRSGYWLVWPEHRPLRPVAKRFVSWLEQQVRAEES